MPCVCVVCGGVCTPCVSCGGFVHAVCVCVVCVV